MKALTLQQIDDRKPFGISKIIGFADEAACVRKSRRVVCQCICGNVFTTKVERISSGHTASCGCKRLKSLIKRNTKYKNNILKINKLYLGIMTRCYTKNHPSYPRYGGVGVTVCDEWKNDYQSFLDWCLNNGWQEGLHLDKDIKGTSFLYSPETCIFVTPRENLTYPKRSTRIKNAKHIL